MSRISAGKKSAEEEEEEEEDCILGEEKSERVRSFSPRLGGMPHATNSRYEITR